MSGGTVFLFLLDNLPDFQNALNTTLSMLSENNDLSFDISNLQVCNPMAAKSVLANIENDIQFKNSSTQDSTENIINKLDYKDMKDAYKELSPEALYNIGTVFDNTNEDSDNVNSLETTKKLYENNPLSHPEHYKDGEDKSEYDIDNTIDINNDVIDINATNKRERLKFPESAPFLVAIFETLSNVTAQTCGGTLLSPQWVLTAASCIDLLSYLYSRGNRTNLNKTQKSVYTIIAGAANPLRDGSAHRVTQIVMHPPNAKLDGVKHTNVSSWESGNKSNVRLNIKRRIPSLALMRIVPAANLKTLQISRNVSHGAEEIQVYGWVLAKNDRGNEVMNATTFSAKTLQSEECRANYSFLDHTSTICLSPQNGADVKVNQMNSGGPVLVLRNNEVRVLGVAQLDQHAPLLAHSLATHADWIDRVLKDK